MYNTGCFWTCWGKFRILLGEQFPQSSQAVQQSWSHRVALYNKQCQVWSRTFIYFAAELQYLSIHYYNSCYLHFATFCIENTAEHHPSTMENCQNVVVFLYYFNDCCKPLLSRPNFLPSIVFIKMNKDNIRNCFFNEWIDFFHSGISKKRLKFK